MNEVITNNDVQCTTALAALHNIIDPEIGLNIVDLGLIYQIDFDETAKEIFMSMTLTTQYCPMGASIKDGAERVLQHAFPQYTIHLQLLFDPPWRPSRISEEGQAFLNRY
ncbi:metal-sulfur cluster assembly factor [Ilyomonas limi]|uniref:Metal-sulfur cluster assembly factor n=1 Tax=Ilyomonas limi TaxID=2575867 RepID=A0A4U3L5B7_9BACT|nr:metal-sulfur cluster assembly factor [Ilyomonas limi]TKK68807.1 metal-sulfur cluster assembly factor [Ilyomonas limi]